jgi:tetratricopeptide (TPR) repeat protein
MNTKTYTNLLANPSAINKEDLGDLAMVIEKYPYFQSARALQLKGLKNENSFLYNDALKLTAAYTTDRDILFEYITSETFVQNQISEIILQQSEAVRDLEVVSESISEQVALEIDQQLKTEMKKAEAILNPDLFERKIESVVQISNEGSLTSEENEEDIAPTETTEEPETDLKIDAPLDFTKKDTHTFGEWLKLTKANPIVREEPLTELEEKPIDRSQEEKNRKFELIEKFIQDRPKLSPSEITSKNKNLAKPYIQSPDTHMTETLAKVYLQQKNYKKAIQAYKILILKNPEKSGFFADQIRAIQQLIKEQ